VQIFLIAALLSLAHETAMITGSKKTLKIKLKDTCNLKLTSFPTQKG